MRQQDGLHRAWIDPQSLQQPAHLHPFAHQACIEKHRATPFIHQEMTNTHNPADGVDARRHMGGKHAAIPSDRPDGVTPSVVGFIGDYFDCPLFPLLHPGLKA